MARTPTIPKALLLLIFASGLLGAAAPPAAAEGGSTPFLIQAPYGGGRTAGNAVAVPEAGTSAASVVVVDTGGCFWSYECYGYSGAEILAFLPLAEAASEVQVHAVVATTTSTSSDCYYYYWCDAATWLALWVYHDTCGTCSAYEYLFLPSYGSNLWDLHATLVNQAGGAVPPGNLTISVGIAASARISGYDWYWCTFYGMGCTIENDASVTATVERIEGAIGPAAVVRDVQAGPDSQSQMVAPRGTVTYDVTITNLGTVTERIGLTLSGERKGWAASLNQSSVELGPGESATVQVFVTAGQSGTLTATLTATSQDDAKVTDTVSLTTRVQR